MFTFDVSYVGRSFVPGDFYNGRFVEQGGRYATEDEAERACSKWLLDNWGDSYTGRCVYVARVRSVN